MFLTFDYVLPLNKSKILKTNNSRFKKFINKIKQANHFNKNCIALFSLAMLKLVLSFFGI